MTTEQGPASGCAVPARDARGILQNYVLKRLRAECAPYGKAAELARKIDFARPTLSNVLSGKTAPGERLMHALATYWGMTYGRLEEVALAEHAAATGPRRPDGRRHARREALPSN